jgi:hypothetical protein
MKNYRDGTWRKIRAWTSNAADKIPTRLTLGFLLCDALWLIGDDISGLAETKRNFLRFGAWALAAVLCCLAGIVLSAKASVVEAAKQTFTASMAAAVPVVAIGLIWFPRQFMGDTELFNFLVWMIIPVTLVSFAFAGIALVASFVAKLVQRMRVTRQAKW